MARLGYAWAARSLLCAWAPGFERTYGDTLTPDEELRVVLEPGPSLRVTVHAPPRAEPFGEIVQHARVRIRLVSDGAVEHPGPREQRAAEGEQVVETGVDRAVRTRGAEETGCYRLALRALHRYWGPDARTLCESFQRDPDPDVRRTAAELLSAH